MKLVLAIGALIATSQAADLLVTLMNYEVLYFMRNPNASLWETVTAIGPLALLGVVIGVGAGVVLVGAIAVYIILSIEGHRLEKPAPLE